MLVESTNASSAFGPYFGVQVFDDSSGPINQIGGFGLDATTGELISQDGTGQLIFGETVELDTWHRFRIELDFGSQSYRGFIGEEVVVQEAFQSPASRFSDADIIARSSDPGSASRNLAGVAYFDNFIVRDGLRGDYNNNGVVDAADYTVWRDQLGMTGSGLAADGNADGEVTTFDYQLWRSSYGVSNAIGGTAIAVPEPAGILLITITLATCLASGRSQ